MVVVEDEIAKDGSRKETGEGKDIGKSIYVLMCRDCGEDAGWKGSSGEF